MMTMTAISAMLEEQGVKIGLIHVSEKQRKIVTTAQCLRRLVGIRRSLYIMVSYVVCLYGPHG